MAKNMIRAYSPEKARAAVCTQPATPVSGDPVLVGQMPGVALTNEETAVPNLSGNAVGECTVAHDGTWALPVKGVDGGGNSVVARGDILYYVAGDTPPLSKKATGVRYGYYDGSATIAGGATNTTAEVVVGYQG